MLKTSPTPYPPTWLLGILLNNPLGDWLWRTIIEKGGLDSKWQQQIEMRGANQWLVLPTTERDHDSNILFCSTYWRTFSLILLRHFPKGATSTRLKLLSSELTQVIHNSKTSQKGKRHHVVLKASGDSLSNLWAGIWRQGVIVLGAYSSIGAAGY